MLNRADFQIASNKTHFEEQVDDIKEDPKAIDGDDLAQEIWLANTFGSGNGLRVVMLDVMRVCVPVIMIFREWMSVSWGRKMSWSNFEINK